MTSTGQMGQFRITSESSVAAGIRRIEAVTGTEALRMNVQEREILDSVRERLGAGTEDIFERINSLLQEKKTLEKELSSYKAKNSKQEIDKLVQDARQVDGFKLVCSKIESPDVDFLKQHGDMLRDALKSGVGVLGAEINGKVNFLCVVTDDLIKSKKLSAGNLVKQIAAIAGGSGGGRPHLALAGAKNPEQLDSALDQVETIIKENIK